jgi:hypothetical protein
MIAEDKCINFESLEERAQVIKTEFERRRPFRYVAIDEFCVDTVAVELARNFPKPDGNWIDASGLNTRRKLTSPPVREGTLADQFFSEASSKRFLAWLKTVTAIEGLLVDETYFGAGFHQTRDGGYLNIHVDFNRLPNGLDRRLNLLVYMNEVWMPDWGGEIELWDVDEKRCVFSSLPKLNRALIFETNEISFHGQPNPVCTGGAAARNSFSIYYYSQGRPDHELVDTHSTVYINLNGVRGLIRTLFNSIRQAAAFGPIRRRIRRGR